MCGPPKEVKRGLKVCEWEKSQLACLWCGDDRQGVIALAIQRETTVALDWIADLLGMGTRSTVNRVAGALAKRLVKDSKLAKPYQRIANGTIE